MIRNKILDIKLKKIERLEREEKERLEKIEQEEREKEAAILAKIYEELESYKLQCLDTEKDIEKEVEKNIEEEVEEDIEIKEFKILGGENL